MSESNLLTEDQAAERLQIKTQTLRIWRSTRRYDLPFVKVGRAVRYRPADVEAWITARTVGATQE